MKVKPYVRQIALKEGFDHNHYPFNIPAISKFANLEFHEDITFFIGENGSGKSTLLEAIAVSMGLGKEGGTRNSLFETAETTSSLHNHLKVVKSFEKPKTSFFLRAESLYNVASYLDELQKDDPRALLSYGGKSLHNQSHGESFMALLLHKFHRNGLYLLDEPEAALSPGRQLAALIRIHELIQEGSQFIIATHSPILLAYPNCKIVFFDEHGLHEIEYEQTEHFIVTRDFLNNYKRRLSNLFAPDN